MGRTRRKFTAQDKAKIALAAIREHKTNAEIAREHSVHSAQVTQWRKQALANLKVVFERESSKVDYEARESELFEEIGRLQTEVRWLQKKLQSGSLK